MKPSLEDMQLFLAVVETRSFTLAAEKVNKTKSAMSQAVTRVESDLGVKLLYRTTRSLTLTDEGALFYQRCKEIKNIYLDAISEVNSKPQGNISLTYPQALRPIMSKVIKKFNATFPDVSFRILVSDSHVDLINTQTDLAIRVGEVSLQTAKIAKLGELSESLYVSRGYLKEAGGLPSELSQIESWRHIAHDWQAVPLRYKLPKNNEVKVKPFIRCNSLQDLITLTESGLGISRLPDICSSFASSQLVKIAHLTNSPIFYVHMFDNNPPNKIKQFLKVLRAEFKDINDFESGCS